MNVILEHSDGYMSESGHLETYAETMAAIESEAARASEYAAPEDIPDVFPIRWDIQGPVPAGQKSYGYINEAGEIF